MFIARTDKFEYLGFDGEYYKFKSKNEKSIQMVVQAKVVDEVSDIVFMLKEDGKIEPSYATVRKHSAEDINASYNKLFSEKGIPGQLCFDSSGNIKEES